MAEIWGAAIVGVTAVGSGIASADSARSAANQQKDASAAAIAEQRRQFDLTRSDYQPYRDTGVRALGSLETDINAPVTPEEVMSDPGYAFGLSQGQQALDRKRAAAGGRLSGASLKGAAEYATNYATTGYQAAYQRRQDRLNRLAALAGVGQTATAGSAQAGANAAGAIGGYLSSQGDANAASTLAQGNIWANTGNQLGAAASRWAKTPSSNSFTTGVGSNNAGGSPDGYW